MRSRSVTILSAVVMKRRSLAAGWRSASRRRHMSSISTSVRFTSRSPAMTFSASDGSRSVSARTLPAMAASTLPPITRSRSRSCASSAS